MRFDCVERPPYGPLSLLRREHAVGVALAEAGVRERMRMRAGCSPAYHYDITAIIFYSTRTSQTTSHKHTACLGMCASKDVTRRKNSLRE